MNTLDPLSTDVAIVGAGIAGCWTAIKLLRIGISTTVIYYANSDRGGKLGASNLSVGAINTSPLTRSDYPEWLDALGHGQGHIDVGNITRKHLASELDELLAFDPLKNIALGVALKSGSGRILINRLILEIRLLGGRVLDDAWVTRIVADDNVAHGIQYERMGAIGAVYSQFVVLASGGYAGLFQGSVKSGTYGSIHGRLLMAGGLLSNMEFVFKHGYGQPDLGVLTPTEELPGTEIYDEHGTHVEWLEKELFLGRGTNNHFQAFMTWRKGQDVKYFVDFRYRDLHRDLQRLTVLNQQPILGNHAVSKDSLLNTLLERCPMENRVTLLEILTSIARGAVPYDFDLLSRIKQLVSDRYEACPSRIRQIAYFSMGGIAHHRFNTNLENVFVCGEAMHDYGAFRVGGLPWALYLCAAKIISQRIDFLKRLGHLSGRPFNLQEGSAVYDATLFNELRLGLQRYQENGLNINDATTFANWISSKRLMLIDQGQVLDDAVAYLTTGEAIMRSSLVRRESRGCFSRDDFAEENSELANQYTLVTYNRADNSIDVQLVNRETIPRVLRARHKYEGGGSMDDVSEANNAGYFLVKKHLDAGNGGKTAIRTLSKQYTYRELWTMVSRYASFLEQNNIDEGDRVALLLSDRAEWIAMFLAVQQIKAIAVPLNTCSKQLDLLYYLEDSGARLLVSESDLLAGYSIETICERAAVQIVDYSDIPLNELEPMERIVPIGVDTAGFILYSSGRTGKPKGAIHRQGSMAGSAECFAEHCLKITEKDRVFSTAKLFHAYGLGNSLYFPLYFGAETSLESGEVTHDVVTDRLMKLRPTLFFSVPSVYGEILKCGGAGAMSESFASVRLCISAGEALPIDIARDWYAGTQAEVIDGILSTEALHIFCVSNHCSRTSVLN